MDMVNRRIYMGQVAIPNAVEEHTKDGDRSWGKNSLGMKSEVRIVHPSWPTSL